MNEDPAGQEVQATNVVIILLSGTAIIGGLLLMTYVFSVLVDRCCGCFSRQSGLTQEEMDLRNTASSLMTKAGLSTMTREERIRTLEHFFIKTSVPYNNQAAEPSKQLNNRHAAATSEQHLEAQTNKMEIEMTSMKGGGRTEQESKPSQQPAPTEEEEAAEDVDKELQELADLEHNEGTCAICLSEYGKYHQQATIGRDHICYEKTFE
jgi:hypothetical protein